MLEDTQFMRGKVMEDTQTHSPSARRRFRLNHRTDSLAFGGFASLVDSIVAPPPPGNYEINQNCRHFFPVNIYMHLCVKL